MLLNNTAGIPHPYAILFSMGANGYSKYEKGSGLYQNPWNEEKKKFERSSKSDVDMNLRRGAVCIPKHEGL